MAMITFRIDRFGLLISPFIAGVLAIGLLVLLVAMTRNAYAKKIAIVVGVLLFSYLCFSALTVENASDSLDISPHESRTYFTEPEIQAFGFLPAFAPPNSTITSDKFAFRMFEKRWFSETDVPLVYLPLILRTNCSQLTSLPTKTAILFSGMRNSDGAG